MKFFLTVLCTYILYVGLFMIYQEAAIFYPTEKRHVAIDHEGQPGIKRFEVGVEPGIKLESYFFQAKNPLRTIIFFHGSNGNLTYYTEWVKIFQRWNYNVAIVDYRGYGESSGSIKKEQDLYDDGQAFVDYLLDREMINIKKTVFWGQGLGSSVAIELAPKYNIEALFIESIFTGILDTIPAFSQQTIPTSRLRYKFENIEKLKSLSVPLFMIHSKDDAIVPFRKIQDLWEKLPMNKKVLVPGNGLRDDFFIKHFKEYEEPLRDFWILLRER